MTSFIQLAASPELAKIHKRQKLLQIPAQVCSLCTSSRSCKAWCPFGKHSGVWDTLKCPCGPYQYWKLPIQKTTETLPNLASELQTWRLKPQANNNIPTILFFQCLEGIFRLLALARETSSVLLVLLKWRIVPASKEEESCSHMQCHTDEVMPWHNSECCQLSKAICSQQTLTVSLEKDANRPNGRLHYPLPGIQSMKLVPWADIENKGPHSFILFFFLL